MEKFSGILEKDSFTLGQRVGIGRCFDVRGRYLTIGERSAYLCYIAPLASDMLVERLVSHYLSSAIKKEDDAQTFAARANSMGFLKLIDAIDECVKEIYDGGCALIVDGFTSAITCDTKQIPARGIDEPESDRVLRGARDGFTEKLFDNICLLRLRIRSTKLVLRQFSVGDGARSTVIVCYMEDRADKEFVASLTKRIESIKVDALSMSQESLAECLVKRRWYNPFPKFRYTERPDAASAMMLEGSVVIICDNSPQAMILPCSIFDFLQETDDFYFPPLTGSYLRLVRLFVFLLSLFLVPAWYLLIKNPEITPGFLSFVQPSDGVSIPIIVQILIVEFTIDGLKLASMNTPGSLNNSLSVVAGLIIGDFAIEVGWLIPEVILYMSFVAMANFTQPSFELGYAFKFMRVFLLLMVAVLNYWGLALGCIAILLFVVLNRSVPGSRGYLYPLIPFNAKALASLFFRTRLKSSKKESSQ